MLVNRMNSSFLCKAVLADDAGAGQDQGCSMEIGHSLGRALAHGLLISSEAD